MKVGQISAFGVDSLEVVERENPQPGPGQVLVRVRAVSLNYRDLLMVKGLYNPKLRLPRIPCSDGAGEVLAVGKGVTAWKPGDRVAGIFMQNWQEGVLTPAKAKGALGGDIDGMLAEQVVLAETGLVRVPEHLSYVEAATLPCAAVTAWNALGAGNLQPGAAVLIQGTGGVSLFALQFAKWLGMRVFGISSSDEKLQRARTMGLDSGVNYRLHPDWDRWALDETGGEGVDLVVEVGGAGTINRSLRALRMGGTIAQIGVLTSAQTAEPLAVPLLLHKTAHIHGIYVGSRLDFEGMNAAITNAQIRPVVSAADWSQAREALMQMEAGGHYGKAALTIE